MSRRNLALLAGLLGSVASILVPSTAQAEGHAMLIVSRERLVVATPCEIGLYLHDQLAARLHQGQSVAFNLPPGEVALRLATLGTGSCQPGIAPPSRQHLSLRAGEVRRLRIAQDASGFHLLAAPGRP
ncbi:hypothetical protein [Pseudomonas benzenivorans]|uniref:Uncharacterized protein n=1 Tax=Pseudomonas benzenivorans TaxID=556533 RepID=A0ABY5H6E1_9PSED|nr:hypothetical protein [Pseudomonas benzenivorans]UTW06621.1 hypothetical protein KDW96_15785 [Pseudomonas benzenivorans]